MLNISFWPGGLGEAVLSAVGQEPDIVVTRLAVSGVPRSGKPQELLDIFGISAKHIAKAVRQTFANWGHSDIPLVCPAESPHPHSPAPPILLNLKLSSTTSGRALNRYVLYCHLVALTWTYCMCTNCTFVTIASGLDSSTNNFNLHSMPH